MRAGMPAHQPQTCKVGQEATAAPARLTSTLYDVMTTLHTVVNPGEDDVVVAVVMHWLRTGRITVKSDVTVSAHGGRGAITDRPLHLPLLA